MGYLLYQSGLFGCKEILNTEILNFCMLFMVLTINSHMSLWFIYVSYLLLDYKLHEEGAIRINHFQVPGTVLICSRYSITLLGEIDISEEEVWEIRLWGNLLRRWTKAVRCIYTSGHRISSLIWQDILFKAALFSIHISS